MCANSVARGSRVIQAAGDGPTPFPRLSCHPPQGLGAHRKWPLEFRTAASLRRSRRRPISDPTARAMPTNRRGSGSKPVRARSEDLLPDAAATTGVAVVPRG